VGTVRTPATTAKGNLRWMLTANARMSPKRFQIARPTARLTGLISTARRSPSSWWDSETSALAVRSAPATFSSPANASRWGSLSSSAFFRQRPSPADRAIWAVFFVLRLRCGDSRMYSETALR
jgi:hypothetical protein